MRQRRGQRLAPLFDLAPDGVCLAPAITGGPVVSYTAFSPLPARVSPCGGLFLWHFPSTPVSRRRSSLDSGTSCPAESGLSSPTPPVWRGSDLLRSDNARKYHTIILRKAQNRDSLGASMPEGKKSGVHKVSYELPLALFCLGGSAERL